MLNFGLKFLYSPWILLILVPAFALTLISYFRLTKKYRKTRNRITSIVLHIIIMLLAISTLSGMQFTYSIYNDQNEIIFLVDVSETEEQSQQNRDDFIETALKMLQYDNCKIGIVTFGFDQRYTVPLTDKVTGIYDKYINNPVLPDTSATNIAAALNYAKDLFEYPETAKIVLITDGKETDDEALSVIGAITAQKIRIDTVYISSEYEGDDVQLVNAELPNHHVNVGDECTIKVTLQSKSSTTVMVELYDGDTVDIISGRQLVSVLPGTNVISFKHKFATKGFHQITFKVNVTGDLLEQNNQYITYMVLDVFNKILILERNENESVLLTELLTIDDTYEVTVKNVYTSDDIPKSVDELRAYDQVILNNISNADLVKNDKMPREFDKLLHTYVNKFGGGLLTVGGNDQNGGANAYNRRDMYGSIYQQMLPVQAINYTPPLGVMVIIDRSGSMGSTDSNGVTYLDWAKSGAASCLNALSERDYFGLMTLDDDYSTILPLTPCIQEPVILDAIINKVGNTTGGTVFPGAIERAGQALRALKAVDRRHIIIVTDGGVPEDQLEQYEKLVKEYYETDKITLSVVAIGMTKDSGYDETTPIDQLYDVQQTPYIKMLRAVILGHGRLYAIQNASTLVPLMREDLNVRELKEVNPEPFYPTVSDIWSPVISGVDRGGKEGLDNNKITVELDGFYGVKIKTAANLILTGEFEVPIYAQWKLGKGTVGSFMCDLNGTWSSGFMGDANGQKIIYNIINNLMPNEDISPNEISVSLKEYNYLNQLSVYTNLEKGQYIQGQIVESSSPETVLSLNTISDSKGGGDSDYYVTLALSLSNNYTRCHFVIKKSGTYKISLTKYTADGTAIDTYEMYKTFSYSKEFNTFVEETQEDLKNKLLKIATRGNGLLVEDLEDPNEILEGFNPYIDRTYDPRFLFIILAIVLFLLDVIVRKFKFKWPHEIFRSFKEKRLGK